MGKTAIARWVLLVGMMALAAAGGLTAADDQSGNNDADRYCEFVAITTSGTAGISNDYPTEGYNDCPASWWDAIDVDKVAADLNADQVIKNGPRYWVMDDLFSFTGPTQIIVVDGLNLGLVATVTLDTSSGATPAYATSNVKRYTRYSYFAGTTIYRLTDPDGNVYVMQSYSVQQDTTLTRAGLLDLGDVIKPPTGWSYSTKKLDEDFFICTNGGAHVIQDELANSYQLVEDEPCVLSAYYGAAILPQGIDQSWCPGATAAGGLGGMPFALDQAIDPGEGYGGVKWALDPKLFTVTVGPHAEAVTPTCATLQPAIDGSEQKTVLLAGAFGLGGDNVPTGVTIVGDLRTADGKSLMNLEIVSISPFDAGSNLTYAEAYAADGGAIETSAPGDDAYCPRGKTAMVVKLTFSGGVSGPNGGALTDSANALAAISVLATDTAGARRVLTPFALRDDDHDNYLDACLGSEANGLTLKTVSVNSHTFYSPMNAPNQVAAVRIEKR